MAPILVDQSAPDNHSMRLATPSSPEPAPAPSRLALALDLIRWNRLKEPVTLEPERVLYLYERPAGDAETTGQDSSGRPIQVFKEDLKDVLDKSKEGLRSLGRKVRNVGK